MQCIGTVRKLRASHMPRKGMLVGIEINMSLQEQTSWSMFEGRVVDTCLGYGRIVPAHRFEALFIVPMFQSLVIIFLIVSGGAHFSSLPQRPKRCKKSRRVVRIPQMLQFLIVGE